MVSFLWGVDQHLYFYFPSFVLLFLPVGYHWGSLVFKLCVPSPKQLHGFGFTTWKAFPF